MPNDRSNLELMLHSRSYPLQYASEFAETSIAAVGDQIPPKEPASAAATAIGAGIRVTWELPTLNVDGTTMTDLRWHRIYYHTGSGIDISNPATYTGYKVVGAVDEYTDEPIAAGTARYYVITALDRTGNQSTASAEVNATAGSVVPTTSIPDDATGLVFDDSVSADGIVLGDGIIGVVFVTPDAAWANFDRYKLEFAVDTGGGFGAWTEIANVPRTAYIHKSLNTTHAYKYRAYVVATDGTISTTPDLEDNAGAGFTPNIADNDAIVAVLVLAEYIIATNEIRAPMIKGGTITGDKISSATTITAGTGNDVGVLDGADATYRIYAGHATPGSAPFRVTKAGAVTCSNLTITGGSINLNAGVFAVDAAGAVTCSNITITGAGSTWGGAVFGTAYIPNLSTDKLTTGVLIVARTQAKCTDANADQTSANVAASISGQGALATRNSVNQTYIDANSVRTSELYLDGNVNFAANAVWHGAYNINELNYYTIGTTTSPYIKMTSGILTLAAGTNAGKTLNVLASSNIIVRSTGGDLYLACGDSSDTMYFQFNASTKMVMVPSGAYAYVGVGTLSPDGILSTDQSIYFTEWGNDWSTYSRLEFKEDIKPLTGVLSKLKGLKVCRYKMVPKVTADELRDAAIEEFGQDRWDSLYPDEISYRGGALMRCPDSEMKAFMDIMGDRLREERRQEPECQKERLGLIADDPTTAEYIPEAVKTKDDGSILGLSLASQIGFLMGAVQELALQVEALQAA